MMEGEVRNARFHTFLERRERNTEEIFADD